MTARVPRQTGGTGPRPARIALGLLWAAATSAVLVALYYLLPLDRDSVVGAALGLGVGLVVFAGAVYREVRAIVRSRAPVVRAIQALAWLVPFFLLLFASTYYMLSTQLPGAFSEPLSRSDALYFTVVTFATVGFGDVVPRAEGVRLLVSGQVLLDLVILGLGVRVILEAVRQGRAAA